MNVITRKHGTILQSCLYFLYSGLESGTSKILNPLTSEAFCKTRTNTSVYAWKAKVGYQPPEVSLAGLGAKKWAAQGCWGLGFHFSRQLPQQAQIWAQPGQGHQGFHGWQQEPGTHTQTQKGRHSCDRKPKRWPTWSDHNWLTATTSLLGSNAMKSRQMLVFHWSRGRAAITKGIALAPLLTNDMLWRFSWLSAMFPCCQQFLMQFHFSLGKKLSRRDHSPSPVQHQACQGVFWYFHNLRQRSWEGGRGGFLLNLWNFGAAWGQNAFSGEAAWVKPKLSLAEVQPGEEYSALGPTTGTQPCTDTHWLLCKSSPTR